MFTICVKKPADWKISRFFLFTLFVFSHSSTADQPSPFLSRNLSPFSLIYGLPSASSAQLLESQHSRWISSINISNTLNVQTADNDNLLIDIETWQLSFLYDYAFKEGWMLRLQLPYIIHSGGHMDSSIDAYHQLLSLPEGKRPYFSDDQIDVRYMQNNTLQLEIDNKQNSIGDISIQLAWQAQQTKDTAASYWLSLKLPTGDSDKLTGSGGTDIAAWTSMNYRLVDTRWLYGQAGLLYMSSSDVLQSMQNHWAVFANAGIKFEPWKNIALKAQFDMHSALYDSDIRFLGDILQVTFGGSYQLNKKHKLDFSMTEDIHRTASPDAIFNFSWWVKY